MHHDLKIEEQYFDRIADGTKTFEIRFNDRGYQTGDTVTLTYCFNKIHATIGFVTYFQQKEGYMVFSLLNVTVYREGVMK